MFSFNSPYGACHQCSGQGFTQEFDPELIVPEPSLSLAEGAVHPWGGNANGYYQQFLASFAAHFGVDMHKPFNELSARERELLFYGASEPVSFRYRSVYHATPVRRTFPGIIALLEKRWETESEESRGMLSRYMSTHPCPSCGGVRLKETSLAVTVGGLNIAALSAFTVEEALVFLENLELTEREQQIARQVLKEICARLRFLLNVGLGYLTLDRSATTLSGGEAQRIRLATRRFRADRRNLYSGRTEHRPAPAGQPPPAADAV